MRTQSVRVRGGVVRVANWHGRTDVASVSLRGRGALAPDAIERILDRLRRAGYRQVVTNALAPPASLPFVDAGFSVRNRLRVLARDLGDVPPSSGRTRRGRRGDRRAVLAVDAAAFDDDWRLDEPGWQEARRATATSHVRVTTGTVDGYALVGREGSDGYVQRLAVHPDHQHRGLARALLGDGLRWLATRGARRAFVNTQSDNDRAYALYERAGFSSLPIGLCVLERGL